MKAIALTVHVLFSICLAGCAPSLKSQYADVARVVNERTGRHVVWNADERAEIAVNDAIRPVLAHPLSVAEAVQIALINNHSMQAKLAGVGVSRAELVQAGLFKDPQLFSRYRRNTQHSDLEEYELRLTQDLMDMLTMPLRRRVASQELERVKAEVAHEALDLAGRTQEAYFTLQANMEARGFSNSRHEIAKLDFEILAGREKLNRLMGLTCPLAKTWTIDPELPPIPAQDPPCENLEELAVNSRLDLTALRDANAKIMKTIQLQQILRWVPILNAGVDYEKKSDIQRVIGPVLTVEIPIFDWGQGRIAKSRALRAQFQHEAAALEIDIRSQAREACARLNAARSEVEFHDAAPPNDAKADEAYTEALRDYWLARVKMGQVLGARIGEWGMQP